MRSAGAFGLRLPRLAVEARLLGEDMMLECDCVVGKVA